MDLCWKGTLGLSQQIGVLRACHFASGHRQRHRLRRPLRSMGWRWWPRLQELRAGHGLRQEFHNEHHWEWQHHPKMRAMPRWGKDLQCHCSGDDARFPGQKAFGKKLSAFCIFFSPKRFGRSLHQKILREACGESMHGSSPWLCEPRPHGWAEQPQQILPLPESTGLPRWHRIIQRVDPHVCRRRHQHPLTKKSQKNRVTGNISTSWNIPGWNNETTTFHASRLGIIDMISISLKILWMFGVFTRWTRSLENRICRRLWRRGLQPMCGGLRPVRQQRLYLRQMCVLALGIGVGQMQTLSFCTRSGWMARAALAGICGKCFPSFLIGNGKNETQWPQGFLMVRKVNPMTLGVYDDLVSLIW